MHSVPFSSLCRIACVLDTRCPEKEKCLYCDRRCDFCLTPCLQRHKYNKFPHVGVVQSCTKSCTNALFAGKTDRFLEKTKDRKGQFVPFGHEELMRGYFSGEPNDAVGLKTIAIFSLCQTSDSRYGVPCGMKYVKFWQRDLRHPYFVEYKVDDQFNPIAMLDVNPDCISTPVFSRGEETEMMHQFHQTLERVGIPYHVFMM